MEASEGLEQVGRGRWFRLAVRCCFAAAAVILALPILPWPWTSLVFPSLSPYVLIASAVASRALGAAALIGAPVLAIVLIRRRWFCRYGCPVGLLTEQVGRLRSSGRFIGGKLPPIGRWAALLTLGGAILGYPLFLWMDPLAIFHSSFSLWDDPLNRAGQWSAVGLAVVLGISLLAPGAWCLRLCPLGATQELLVIPQRWLRRAASSPQPATTGDSGLWSRRSVFSAGIGAVCLGVGARWASAAVNRFSAGRPKLLRPPGAIDDERFVGVCLRCGNCVRACPTRIIRSDLGSDGIAGLLAPAISFSEDYCREDCRRCLQVCPSGAIARLSLEAKKEAPIGLAKVDPSLCLLSDDRECDICARVCPYEAIDIVWSEEKYVPLPRVNPDKCPGCGACQVMCPGENDWERQHSDTPIPLRKAIEVARRQ